MHYKPLFRTDIQNNSLRFFVFWVVFLILIPPSFALAENSRKELFQECVEGDCQNGKGTMIYYSTQKYIGEFRDGKKHGQGTLYLPLKRVMKGKWVNDEIIEGSATLSDGTRYSGGWQFGYRHGRGKLTYPDGREYIGDFHDGQKHGMGTMRYPDGRIYTGQYKKGQRTGFGTMAYPNGKKITGQFSDGEYIEPEE